MLFPEDPIRDIDALIAETDRRIGGTRARRWCCGFGIKHRGTRKSGGVEQMNTERNLMEKASSEKSRASHASTCEKLRAKNAAALENAEMDKTLTVEAYKAAVTRDLGRDLDAGHGVIAGLSGHYVRRYAIREGGVMVQDPGSWQRSETHVTWAEARAMGYFYTNLVNA